MTELEIPIVVTDAAPADRILILGVVDAGTAHERLEAAAIDVGPDGAGGHVTIT